MSLPATAGAYPGHRWGIHGARCRAFTCRKNKKILEKVLTF